MIVNEAQVICAMQHWERLHIAANGPLDRINLPKECNLLAEILGTMWFQKETQTEVPDDSEIARLIKESM